MPPFGPSLYLLASQRQPGSCAARKGCYCALLHDLVVVNSVSDVDVWLEGDVDYSRVQIEDIRRSRRSLCMEVCVYTLYEGGLSGARHSNGYNTGR